jgi:hypothetical protein
MSQIGIDTCPSADDSVHLVMVEDDLAMQGSYQILIPEHLSYMSGVILTIMSGHDEALAYCRLLPAGSRVFLVSDGDLGVPNKNGPDLLDAFRCLVHERGFMAGMRLLSGLPEWYQREPKLRFLPPEHRWAKGSWEWIDPLRQGLEELRAKQAPLTHTKPHSISPSTAPSAEG